MDKEDCFTDTLLHGPEVYSIVGASFEVLKALGPGLHEKPYENALVVELGLRGHRLEQQKSFPISYKGVDVGVFVPDLIVDQVVIVDTKSIDRITSIEIGQMIHCLRIAGLRVGLIINFRNAKLQWQRVIL